MEMSKQMVRGVVVAALAVVMVAGAAASSFAQGPKGRAGGPGFGPGFGGGLPPLHVLAVALDLTEAQQEQIRTIVAGQRDTMQQLGQRMRTARQGVEAAVRAPQVNEAGIRSAVAALSQVQADAAVVRAQVRQEVFALFTPEQRAKAEQLEQSRRSGWGERGPGPRGQRAR
jgi:Spy/CpxP family protein refolding chaperone